MIKIQTRGENDEGYYMEVHIEGDSVILIQQLSSAFDKIYEQDRNCLKLRFYFPSILKIIHDII